MVGDFDFLLVFFLDFLLEILMVYIMSVTVNTLFERCLKIFWLCSQWEELWLKMIVIIKLLIFFKLDVDWLVNELTNVSGSHPDNVRSILQLAQSSIIAQVMVVEDLQVLPGYS